MNAKWQNLYLLFFLFLMVMLAVEMKVVQAQQDEGVRYIAWSHNGKRVAIGYSDGTIGILNVEPSQVEHTTQAHVSGMPVSELAWSPTDDFLASGDVTGNITVWDTSSWLQIADLNETDDSISLLSWNGDGSRLVAFSYGYPPLVQWNTTNFDLIETSNDAGPLESIAWSPRRNQVITGISTGGFIVRNPNDFAFQNSVDELWLTALAWSSDGNIIATGNAQGTVKLWDASTFEPYATLMDGVSQVTDISTTTSIQAVAFSADSQSAYALRGDGMLMTWDTTSLSLLDSQQLPGAPIDIASFSPNGSQLAYAGIGGSLAIID